MGNDCRLLGKKNTSVSPSPFTYKQGPLVKQGRELGKMLGGGGGGRVPAVFLLFPCSWGCFTNNLIFLKACVKEFALKAGFFVLKNKTSLFYLSSFRAQICRHLCDLPSCPWTHLQGKTRSR